MMSPVISIVQAPLNKSADFIRTVSGLAEMQEENARLKAENLKLQQWYQKALLLQDKNKELNELLNLPIPQDYTFASGNVIADSGNAYVKSVLINIGQGQGVAKGNAVLGENGLAGRVIDAGSRTSRVLLITDVNSRIPVYVEGTGYKAIMAGQNTDNPYILHVDDDVDLKNGSRVITSGHGGVFPYGLVIGSIQQSAKGRIEVVPFADLANMRFVKVTKGVEVVSVPE